MTRIPPIATGTQSPGQVFQSTEPARKPARRQPAPESLADVAHIDGPGAAAAGCLSISQWHALVREGRAPQPVIRAPRFTRWRLSDVRAWLIERESQGDTAQGQDAARTTLATAAAASQTARTKRKAAAAESKAA